MCPIPPPKLIVFEFVVCRPGVRFHNNDPCNPQGHCIPAQPTLVNMSRSELSFALLVEEALVRVPAPESRQLCVELLCVCATILRRNPELQLQQALHLDRLLDDAQLTYAKVRQTPASCACLQLHCVSIVPSHIDHID